MRDSLLKSSFYIMKLIFNILHTKNKTIKQNINIKTIFP